MSCNSQIFTERRRRPFLRAKCNSTGTSPKPMIIISHYSLEEKPNSNIFFVRSEEEEEHACPICGGILEKYGRRHRNQILCDGTKRILSIRRLRCSICNKIHHELPDCLVPYKRYEQKAIEKVLSSQKNQKLDVAVDECVILRWRAWFDSRINHFIGCLRAIDQRLNKTAEGLRSCLPPSSLQGIYSLVGKSSNWLARVVRSVVNSNNWK